MSALDVLFVPIGCRGFSDREFTPAGYFVSFAAAALVGDFAVRRETQRHSGFAHL
jgi:hypothetical protein